MTIEEILARPDGSIDNISVNLDSTEFSKKYDLLNLILQKLSLSGTITITGRDIFDFANDIIYGQASISECNLIISDHKSMDTIDNVKRFLSERQLKTISIKINMGLYVLSARY